MVFEQLLNFKYSILWKSIILVSKVFVFYVRFAANELTNLSTQNLFVWKSANFADSYWFLYNDKSTLTNTVLLK